MRNFQAKNRVLVLENHYILWYIWKENEQYWFSNFHGLSDSYLYVFNRIGAKISFSSTKRRKSDEYKDIVKLKSFF